MAKDERLPSVNQAGTLWEPPSDIDPAQVEQLISATENSSPTALRPPYSLGTAKSLSTCKKRQQKKV